MSLTPGLCIAPTCQRKVTGGHRICRRCWRHIPPEMVLALHDHADTNRRAPELADFIAWSMTATERCAAWEASRRRIARRQGRDPDDTARFWAIGVDGALSLQIRADSSTRSAR